MSNFFNLCRFLELVLNNFFTEVDSLDHLFICSIFNTIFHNNMIHMSSMACRRNLNKMFQLMNRKCLSRNNLTKLKPKGWKTGLKEYRFAFGTGLLNFDLIYSEK
ncbi:hypothetical protein BpHYR1_019420 [Brachionus plicatilis]|uniref:Uncharacterized protein n=1 Tax=Brachionus plicatilis TaxID=10195 RepID=A0A3M7RDY6_BRAPC|nr:hypothetical protein BpHYR1_019420 [Brachionus plicatilis]